MSSSLDKYYVQKNKHITLDSSSKKKLERRIRSYYKVFKDNDNKTSFDIIYEFRRKVDSSLTYNEAEYIYNLCRNKYLNDITPLPPKESKTKEELSFNNLNEWAEYRAIKGTRFKDMDFYKCLVEFYPRDKPARVKKLLEEKFQLDKPMPNSYVAAMYKDYCKTVKRRIKEA